jgi:toxin ParE1/3/4
VTASVSFRPKARRDVLEQMLYFEEQANEETALRYYDAVLVTCSLLAQKPLMGKAFETKGHGLQQLRRFPVRDPFGNYLNFYEPGPSGIDVVRVLHGSRDIEPVLAEQGVE